MRNILLIPLFILSLWGCTDEEDGSFGTSVSGDRITFKAVPGGAIMYYDLKGHKDIFSIRAMYTDVLGQEVKVDGTYLSDSLNLVGFNEAQRNIPVQVSFFNHKLEESKTMELAFDTEDSAPVAFFDHVKVTPSWNGFSVVYESPVTTGFAHVFYLGENPKTHEIDTIWLESVSIRKGRDTLSFMLQQERSSNTVIIATEDFRGYRVKQQIWENVEAYAIEQFPSSKIQVLDPCNIVVKNEKLCMGPEYLFDGDTKPLKRLGTSNPERQYCMFGAGKNAVGQYWIMDLGEEKTIAKLRMFAPYRYGTWLGWEWRSSHINKLPSEVTVYGSNDQVSWTKLGYFFQPYLQPGWVEEARTSIMDYNLLQAAEPVYADINCMALPQGFRYVKFMVNKTFYDEKSYQASYADNPDGYVALSELEVYVKKE
ncbi:DUF4959 domain-containing protein [Butyricimonas sp. Marseille-P3923]|uniref:DUF4959 domain-containing protein n=1 Tax=Butyricimonas sp. Marseille-P3923 TaxID=1987504 RepID=UPI00159BDCFE|nr:DUF4959 domain-containing protein [Butyricimonas sp. Marseille-P3923]